MKFRIPNFKKEQPELFEWWDAVTELDTTIIKLRKIKDTRGMLAIKHTIGYKIAEDKHAIIVCTEMCPNDKEDEQTLDTTTIPKKWLVKK